MVVCSGSGAFPGSAASSSPPSLGAGRAGSDPGEPRPGGDGAEQSQWGWLSLEPPVDVAVRESQPQLSVPRCLGSAQSSGTLEFIIS